MKIYKINEIIKTEITGKGKDSETFRIEFIKSNWEKIVGKTLSQNSYPSYEKKAILYIKVNNSVWIQQMQFYKSNIIEEINKILNGKYIVNVNFFSGEIKNRNINIKDEDLFDNNSIVEEKIEKENLTQEEIYSIKKSISIINDLELKKSMYKTMVINKKREKILKELGYKKCVKCGITHNEKENICFLCKNEIKNDEIKLIKKNIYTRPYISFLEIKEIFPNITKKEFQSSIEYIKWSLMNKIKILKYSKNSNKLDFYIEKYIMAETGIKNNELLKNKIQLFKKSIGL